MLEAFRSIRLDSHSKIPLYQQLADVLAGMVEQGVLLPDFRLPSIRQLAQALDVNTVTIVTAYKQLVSRGLAYTREGSGTYIAWMEPGTKGQGSLLPDEMYSFEDFPALQPRHIQVNASTINFASATPAPDLFPVQHFKTVLNEVLDRFKGNAFSYQDSHGILELRESLSLMLEKSGLNCQPGSIQIISGAQQGIDIISKALLREGDWVITESPTYTGAIAVFKSRGAEICSVSLEDDGPHMGILEYSLKKYRPRFIYAIPSFQNPTGISYNLEKRKELVQLAEKYDSYIIEDGYVSELDFDGLHLPSLKALDEYDRVIYIKSFSKIFMPGLRLGFMVVPPKLHPHILEAKHSTDIATSGLIQRAFDLYIRQGYWDRHFQFMYDTYRHAYKTTIGALDAHLPPQAKYHKPGGGLNLWIQLPYGLSISQVARAAAARNVVFAPGNIFYAQEPAKTFGGIRLSFASVNAEEIESGIAILGQVLDEMLKGQGSCSNMPIL